MAANDPIEEAVQLVGLARLARELKLTHQAVRRWQRAGRLPRTEWTGETAYSTRIQDLTGGVVTRERLLAKWEPVSEGRSA